MSHTTAGSWQAASVLTVAALVGLISSCGRSEQRTSDLTKRDDIWVSSLTLDSDSKLKYVGKTRDYIITSISTVRDLEGPRTISVGDEIEGIHIGAIQCSFFWRDASYGGEQYMWRGRWGCQAGRNEDEVERAVGRDGEKRFEYLHISPVSLPQVVDSVQRWCEHVYGEVDVVDRYAPVWAVLPTLSIEYDSVRADYVAMLNEMYLEVVENRAERMVWTKSGQLHIESLATLMEIEADTILAKWDLGIEAAREGRSLDESAECFFGVAAELFDTVYVHTGMWNAPRLELIADSVVAIATLRSNDF